MGNAGQEGPHYAPKLYLDEIERNGLAQLLTEISVNSLTIHVDILRMTLTEHNSDTIQKLTIWS